MKSAKIAELKNNLSRYLDYVKGGGTVMVLERDRPVAQIVCLSRSTVSREHRDDARLDRLERRGVIRRGSGGLPEWLGKRRPPRLRGSVLQDLLTERARGW
jgi:antitoxin (DNA-binding transcriptional repressor) of toxin-antitoxin stability system